MLLKRQAAAGDLILMVQDESEARTHPDRVHAWAKQGADLRSEASGQARKMAMLGIQDAVSRHWIVETSATKRSTDFIALVARIDQAIHNAVNAMNQERSGPSWVGEALCPNTPVRRLILLEFYEDLINLDTVADGNLDCLDRSRARGGDVGFHFHGFENHDRVVLL